MSKQLYAFSILTGTIIGAGILGIPNVISRSGFPLGVLNILLIGAIVLFVTLCLGEISLRTKGNHQIPGYAEKYLGGKGKKITLLIFTFGIYSALIAYLIGEGESISFLLTSSISSSIKFGILFWALLSILNARGLKSLGKNELIGVSAVLILIISLVALNFNNLSTQNLSYSNLNLFFLPFGVILFAFLGFPAVPEIKKILSKKSSLKKIILISYLAIALVYILFSLIVVGVHGSDTPEIATFSLGAPFIILGMITMFTAYLSLSSALIDMLVLDFKISKLKSWTLTNIPPLLIFIFLSLTKNASFVNVLGVGGAVTGTALAILILAMHSKAKKFGDVQPEYDIPKSNFLKAIILIFLLAATILELIR